MEDVRRGDAPFNEATKIADAMNQVVEGEGVRTIAMVSMDDPDRENWTIAGIAVNGWDDEMDAVAHILEGLTAMFKAQGMELHLMNEEGMFVL